MWLGYSICSKKGQFKLSEKGITSLIYVFICKKEVSSEGIYLRPICDSTSLSQPIQLMLITYCITELKGQNNHNSLEFQILTTMEIFDHVKIRAIRTMKIQSILI
ncbi:hypothetical protein LV85_02302 [Algoriphagus chordae]|uniref:Uncharacterized protein n=1 Tax=Algoriphagus chordae TaxID=237019 RepID=A0A2W7QRX8_9BACT|nr:hypothetical protein LV85_02302 [Algoriphagus chordae]